MHKQPTISVIILNYRSPQLTVQCVQKLQEQSIADAMEILVVDNHSEDDSIGVLRNRLSGYKNVRIIEVPTNRGYGKGNNFGAGYANGEYILIMNPDNQPEASALERMIAVLEEDEEIGILAPKLIYPDGAVRESAVRFPTFLDMFLKRTVFQHLFPRRLDRYLQRSKDPEIMRDTDWVHGACLLLRRSIFEELGGFDPRFFMFFEDIDLCKRCWELGKRVVYIPEIHVADREQRLSGAGLLSLLTKRTGWMHIASAMRYFWKWR